MNNLQTNIYIIYICLQIISSITYRIELFQRKALYKHLLLLSLINN